MRWWLVGLVAVAVLVPSGVSVPLVTAVVVGLAVSRWWTRRSAGGLEVECEVPRWASPDQTVVARVRVRNGSRLPAAWVEVDVPFAMGLGRGEPHREVTTLPPAGRLERRLELRPSARGRYHVGPARIRVGDVLGAGEIDARDSERAEVTVFPRIVPLARLGLPSTSALVTVPAPWSLLRDPLSVTGVREYRPGDPLKAIHWQATARSGDLLVKQYERAEGRQTLVCLDLSPGGYPPRERRPASELAIVVAASVLHHAVTVEHQPAGLLTGTWRTRADEQVLRVESRDDQAGLRRALENLAVAAVRSQIAMAELLAGIGPLPHGTTVVAVTGHLDQAATAQLLRLSREGVGVAAVVTAPSSHGAGESVGRWLSVHRIGDLPEVIRLAS